MLPISNLPINIKKVRKPSKTYKLDLEGKRIVGFIDKLDAIEQSVRKILSTDRYKYLIYSWNYGFEGNSLLGQDTDLVKIAIKRKIKEALLVDDRIIDVSDFDVKGVGDSVTCSFTVNSVEGVFKTYYELGV
ncbi:DUF2634 domain-containing protein [Clostridiaceae bacterium M8S5]|nr:DUF2634 domain-containing protein [Clostridiaceae bacterium M8S5]